MKQKQSAMQKMADQLRSKVTRPNLIVASAIVVFAGLGVTLITASHAATVNIPQEAENGTVAGNANKVADPAASGGNKVTFSAGSGTGTGSSDPTAATCPSPTPTAPVTGYTIVKCEDFNNGLGAFSGYDGGGDGTVAGAGRKSSMCTASGGTLIAAQASDGSTCGGVLNGFNQKYGFWEIKMKMSVTGGGNPTHPVLLLWPDAENWPLGGELDYFETDGTDPPAGWLHCATSAGGNCYRIQPKTDVDTTQFHVYSIEWTPDHMTGYIDNQQWWTTTQSDVQPGGSMHATVQHDCIGCSTPIQQSKMIVDWAHMYKK